MGQEKLPLEGLGMEWGGFALFLIMKVENLYNVLEEKKNNQSLFLGKVCKV
jgi:hypothetical protein